MPGLVKLGTGGSCVISPKAVWDYRPRPGRGRGQSLWNQNYSLTRVVQVLAIVFRVWISTTAILCSPVADAYTLSTRSDRNLPGAILRVAPRQC
jgi:hypothetical protein